MSTRHLAPYADPDVEIWGIGNGYLHLQRADKYFELHRPAEVLGTIPVAEWWPAPAKLGAKVVITHPEIPDKFTRRADGTPTVEHFPFADVLAAFPRRYFTSTFAWLIAYAMLQEPEEIGIWGADMSNSEEWGTQKACVEHMLGIAEGRGIRVVIPSASLLLRSPFLYALDTEAIRHARSLLGDQRRILEMHITKYTEEISQQGDARINMQARIDEHAAVCDCYKATRCGRGQLLHTEMVRAMKNEVDARLFLLQFRARLDECNYYAMNFLLPEPDGDVDHVQEDAGRPAYETRRFGPYDGKTLAFESDIALLPAGTVSGGHVAVDESVIGPRLTDGQLHTDGHMRRSAVDDRALERY